MQWFLTVVAGFPAGGGEEGPSQEAPTKGEEGSGGERGRRRTRLWRSGDRIGEGWVGERGWAARGWRAGGWVDGLVEGCGGGEEMPGRLRDEYPFVPADGSEPVWREAGGVEKAVDVGEGPRDFQLFVAQGSVDGRVRRATLASAGYTKALGGSGRSSPALGATQAGAGQARGRSASAMIEEAAAGGGRRSVGPGGLPLPPAAPGSEGGPPQQRVRARVERYGSREVGGKGGQGYTPFPFRSSPAPGGPARMNLGVGAHTLKAYGVGGWRAGYDAGGRGRGWASGVSASGGRAAEAAHEGGVGGE